MLNRLKDGAKITDQEPTFKARYIGKTETFIPSGKGCSTPLVQKLWDNSEEEHFLKRVQIRITTSGIHMRSLEKKKEPEKLFDIENISFCNVDTAVNDRIFSWIHKDEDSMLECHAVVCSNTEKAKSMSLVLSRAFQIAYKEWKSSQIRSVRDNEKKQRSASLGRLVIPTKMTRSQGLRSQSVYVPGADGIPSNKSTYAAKKGITRAFSESNDTISVEKETENTHTIGNIVETTSGVVSTSSTPKETNVQSEML